MNMGISFFIGLAILLLSHDLGNISNIYIVEVICKIIGILIMGYVGKKYIEKQEQISENNRVMSEKIESVLEDILCKTPKVEHIDMILKNQEKLDHDFANFVNTYDCNFNSNQELTNQILETVKNNDSKIIEEVVKGFADEQDKYKSLITSIKSLHQLPQSILCSGEDVSKKLNETIKEIKVSSGELIEKLENQNLERTNNAQFIVNEISQKVSENIEETKSSINELLDKMDTRDNEKNENVQFVIKEIDRQFIETMEEMKDSSSELIAKMEEQDKKRIKDFAEIISRIEDNSMKKNQEISQKLSENIEETKSAINELLDKMDTRDNEKNENVQFIIEEIDTQFNETMEAIKESADDLIGEIEGRDKNRIRDFREIISRIEDDSMEKNQEIAERIGTLSNSYKQFEKITEKWIKQITMISEKDYEIMKGILDE